MSQQQIYERLKSALYDFQRSLESPQFAIIQSKFASINAPDLDAFLRQQDDNRNPSLYLTSKLSPIKTVLNLTYDVGREIYGFEETILQQLYGCLQCTLWAGHNIYKDMPKIVELLEQTGRSIQPWITGQTHEQISKQLWSCVCLISEEITRLCTVYVCQGMDYRSLKRSEL
jgi:hypothetical protein